MTSVIIPMPYIVYIIVLTVLWRIVTKKIYILISTKVVYVNICSLQRKNTFWNKKKKFKKIPSIFEKIYIID